MPSKLVDYQYVKKPVLTIKPKKLIYKHYLLNEIVCDNDHDKLVELLINIAGKGPKGLEGYKVDRSQFCYDDFVLENVADNYMKIFKECSS